MNKDEIFEELKNILKNEIQINVQIIPDTALLANKILDSMDFMNYITMIEQKYNISISDDDIAKFQLGIMQNMVDYLSGRIS
jgi:acyl carrier protein